LYELLKPMMEAEIIDKKQYTKNFIQLWTRDDNFSLRKYSDFDIRFCLSNCDPDILMNSEEKVILKNLPDIVPVWRGNSADLSIEDIKKSWCWTTYSYTAFIYGYGHASQKRTKIKIVKAYVKREFIQCLWKTYSKPVGGTHKEGDYELIVEPSKIFGEEVFLLNGKL
jgi:hypothetical protein